MQTRQQQTEGKKNIKMQEKKKKFILCKPHRARAQPRSELGRNRVVTVGIENKKQKHFSLLSTAVFTFLFRGRWQQTERKKLLRFTVGEKPHARQWPFQMTVKPNEWFSSLRENNTRTKRKTALNSHLPNSFKYRNIHKKKCDSSSRLLFNYTGYNKQVTTFSTCLTETSI